ncbi:transcriptional regulator [Raoultella terrigena]|nr:transcriptional regulator [Raoultella terrigena]HCR59608.1 transcriptional regulator [Raoultella sp.]
MPHCHFDNHNSHNDYFNHCHFDINVFNEK